MHIAYLTPEYPHERVQRSAGIGTSIKNLATALVEIGHEVTLFIYGQQESDVFNEDGITFHLIAQKKYTLGGFYLYRKHIERYINEQCENIDILEAPDWTGITAFCKFSMPHIIRLHGSDTYFCHIEGRKQKKKNFLLEKWALQKADGVSSVSSFTALTTAVLFKFKIEIPVIHNLINTEDFIPEPTRNDRTILLNLGSIIPKKGVVALAKAFEKLAQTNQKIELHYLGTDVRDISSGLMTSTLIHRELSDSSRKRVRFINHVPYDQVKRHIQNATIVCLPSYAEAFPMTWLEAMALEKPLITSNIGWAHEVMISEKTGITIQPDDTNAFVEAIERMLSDLEFAAFCGQNARLHVTKNFSKTSIVSKNINLYQRIIGS